MKKILKLNMIFLLTFIMLGIPSVLATEPDPGVISVPQTSTSGVYTYDGFKYTVKGLYLDVYESKIEDNKFAGYKKDTLQRIDVLANIDREIIDITFEDVSSDNNEDFDEYKTDTVAKVSIDKTKEELLELIKEKYPTVDSEHHYYIRFVLNYTIDEVPDMYNHYYKFEYTDTNNSFSISSSDQENNSFTMLPVNLSTEISSVFNAFEYKLNANNEEVFNYTSHYEEGADAYVDPLFSGITMYSSIDETKPYIIAGDGVEAESDDPETQIVNEKYTRTVTFTGYDNFEEYGNSALEQLFSALDYDDFFNDLTDIIEKESEGTKEEIAKVENTAATYPLYIYVLSAIGILVGVLVIVSTRLQSKQKQVQQ